MPGVGGETIGQAYIKVLADGDEFEGTLKRIMKKAEPAAEKGGEDTASSFNKGFDKEHEKGLRARFTRVKAWVGLQGRELTKSGDKWGKAFGKGARNDFVNMIGSLVGAMPKALGAMTQWVSGINKAGSASSAAAQKMSAAGGAAGGLGKAFGIVGQIVQAAVMLKLVTSALGMLGAAASLTTGLVLALAGSLGFALVGALVAVAGAMVPFAAAIGVGALAMAGLGKKNSGLKALKKDFEDLQKIAAKGMFGKDGGGLKNLEPVLESLKPLVKGVSEALGGLLDDLGKAAKGKGFQDMMKGISDILPGMVTQLGGIAGKLGLGLGQAFVAAEPLIKRFLGFVDDLAGKFVAFGKGGKKSGLAGFFEEAGKSIDAIAPLILNIIDLVGILFSAGKGTGDKLFKGIADQVQKIVEWLSSKEGQDSLKQWFKDAKAFGEQLGRIVVAVINFVDALDTDRSRAQLMGLLKVIEVVINALSAVVTWWDQINMAVISAGAAVLDWFGALPAMLSGTWATIKGTVVVAFQEIATAIGQTVSDIANFFAPAWNAVITGVKLFVTAFIQVFIDLANELVGHSIIPDMIMDIVGWFARMPGMIAAVLGDLAGRFVIWLAGVPGKIRAAVGLVVGAFGGLAGKAIARAGSIVSAFGKWAAGLPAKAKAMATTVANGFTNLAGKIITKAGSLASKFASWVSSLAGKAKSTATSIVNAFSNLSGKIISKAGSIASKMSSWMASLPGKAKTVANNIAKGFSGLAAKAFKAAGSITSAMSSWAKGVAGKAKGVANDIVAGFKGLASRIVSAIGTIIPKIKMPSIKVPTVVAKVITPKKAAGGIISGPQHVIVGEAGPEAIVPLSRSLARVDPAVRALSAFAQGMSVPNGTNGGNAPSIGRQIDVGGITINTPTTDPRAVATEVVNRMTFAAYI